MGEQEQSETGNEKKKHERDLPIEPVENENKNSDQLDQLKVVDQTEFNYYAKCDQEHGINAAALLTQQDRRPHRIPIEKCIRTSLGTRKQSGINFVRWLLEAQTTCSFSLNMTTNIH